MSKVGNCKPPVETQFKKGASGNPGGIPKWVKEAKKICGAHTPEAIDRLVFWMRSEDPRASIPAANAILDRALGKPKEFVDVDFTQRIVRELSEAELEHIAAGGSIGAAGEAPSAQDDSSVH